MLKSRMQSWLLLSLIKSGVPVTGESDLTVKSSLHRNALIVTAASYATYDLLDRARFSASKRCSISSSRMAAV